MRLRFRTLATVTVVMAVLLGALTVTARSVILRDSERLEQTVAESDAMRLEHALDEDIRQLARVAADWAPRNDTYDFVLGRAPGYAENLLTDETLSSLGVNAVLFLDESGKVAFATGVDLDLGTREPLDAELLDAIVAAKYLQAPGDPRGHASGVMRVPGGVMLVASRAVTSSDMYSPPAGTFIIGRMLDSVEVERLGRMTALSVTATPLNVKAIPNDEARTIEIVDADTLVTHSVIFDVVGTPAVELRATLSRDIYKRGETAVKFVIAAVLILGAAAVFGVLLVIDANVLRRLSALSRELAILAKRHDPSGRVRVRGDDELAALARDINRTLAAIDESERGLVAARDELEVRVIERTAELALSEERHRDLVESMADALFTLDSDGVITLANEAAGELLGEKPVDLLGKPFLSFVSGSSLPVVADYVTDGDRPGWPWTVEASLHGQTCDPVSVEMRVAPLFNDGNARSGSQWIARDVAERRRYEQRLIHLASHDHLTGLANRRQFEDSLEVELASMRRHNTRGAVVWLDLDDFKDVNDSLGHRVGDDVLISVGELLRRHVRESNLLARMGGDEFAVLLPGVSAEEAELAGARLLSAINGHTFSTDGHLIRISASVGLVMYPEHGSTTPELLANADMAMYDAKGTGRARMITAVIGEDRQTEMRSRLMWNEQIVTALDEDRFCAFAQPISSVKTGDFARFELLLRMIDSTGGIVGPMDFLPSAERLGLVREIDRWMVRRAVEMLARYPHEEFALEVNISGQTFTDNEFIQALEALIQSTGIDPARLGLEITETAAITDMARARDFVCAVKTLGCRTALDDFGSGFSSFYYLRHIPVDCLKIDGSFIRELPKSPQDRHLVRAIVELCRGLDIHVAAEYVESEEILHAVESLGIDFAQGYYVGRPEPLADAIDRFVTRTTTSGA